MSETKLANDTLFHVSFDSGGLFRPGYPECNLPGKTPREGGEVSNQFRLGLHKQECDTRMLSVADDLCTCRKWLELTLEKFWMVHKSDPRILADTQLLR